MDREVTCVTNIKNIVICKDEYAKWQGKMENLEADDIPIWIT